MPPKPKSLQENSVKTLASLRNELRNKLIQVGMNLQDAQSVQKVKKSKNVRGRTQEDESLPILQSFRGNKFFMNDIKDIFARRYEAIFKNRFDDKKISKEVVRGIKYDYSINSSRNVSPTEMKDVLKKKILQDARNTLKHQNQLPKVQIQTKSEMREWSETIKVMKLDRPFKVGFEERESLERKVRRSKTEGREPMRDRIKDKKKVKKSIGRQVSPWEGDVCRDTQIIFH